MRYIFDIDGTLADTKNKNYAGAVPDEAMITLVNKLFDEGHHITIITARGTGSDKDYWELTTNQLKSWGVKYNCLYFGRIISDKVITPEEFLDGM